jgi:hypothetical protein
VILNRRSLLASIGLALPVLAAGAAEAAVAKKKKAPVKHITKASTAVKSKAKPHAPV